VISGDVAALERLLSRHEPMLRGQEPPPYRSEGLHPEYSEGDARTIVVCEHDFESWEKFVEYQDELQRKDSLIAQFETACGRHRHRRHADGQSAAAQ
jgi:hypothetical protein